MLNNMTSASFSYGGCRITAKRTVDTATGKFFGWYGEVNDDYAIFAKSINQFEKKFVEFVDTGKAEGKPISWDSPL